MKSKGDLILFCSMLLSYINQDSFNLTNFQGLNSHQAPTLRTVKDWVRLREKWALHKILIELFMYVTCAGTQFSEIHNCLLKIQRLGLEGWLSWQGSCCIRRRTWVQFPGTHIKTPGTECHGGNQASWWHPRPGLWLEDSICWVL